MNGWKSQAFLCAILTIINVHVDHSDQPGAGKKRVYSSVPIEVNLSPPPRPSYIFLGLPIAMLGFVSFGSWDDVLHYFLSFHIISCSFIFFHILFTQSIPFYYITLLPIAI